MPGKVEKIISNDQQHEGEVTSLAFDPEHNVVFSGGADGKVKVWESDLHLKREINAHEALIYALTLDSKQRLFTSSTDGLIKYFEAPRSTEYSKEIMKFFDELYCLICVNDDIFCGDDKGVITWWSNGKTKCTLNLDEEIKSMAVERNLIYTARDNECVITEFNTAKPDKYATKKTFAGKSPLTLCGPVQNGASAYLVFPTLDGKGLTAVDNLTFETLWTQEDTHQMEIKSIFGTTDGFYTGGFDGKVKKWTDVGNGGNLASVVDCGSVCINAICTGPDNSVFVGGSDGLVRKIFFE